MQVIDGNWIKARLRDERGEKARLAEAMGISPDKVSKILKGERGVRPHEIPAVIAFFEWEQPAHAPMGMQEEATPFEGKPDEVARIAQLLAPHARHPVLYTARQTLTGLGILRGDVVVIDLNGIPRDGDIVIATLTDETSDQSRTLLRRLQEPRLISGGTDPAIAMTDSLASIGILGVVVGVARSASVSGPAH